MSPNKTKLRVLVVGQTPPPYHGQGIMIQMLVDGQYQEMDLRHIRMNFSQSLDEIGKVRFGKLLHLLAIILRVYWTRVTFQPQVLYYPPAGPNKAPLIRDAAILIATRWLFRRTVFHFQASGCSEFIPKLSNFWRRIVLAGLRQPDLAIELSDRTVSDGRYLGARKIVKIPNASPDQTTRIPSKASDSPDRSPVRILYLGTMCEGKGSLILIQACKHLEDSGLDFEVHLVGGFQPLAFEQEAQNLIASLGLSHRIHLLGQLTGDAKWEQFAQADLFCFPSHYSSEGFPVVLVEAMSYSLPIVSTQWRGIPDIVDNNQTGFLVPPRNPTALADCLKCLIQNSEMRRNFGNNARTKYLEEYTPEKHRQKMEDAMLSIL